MQRACRAPGAAGHLLQLPHNRNGSTSPCPGRRVVETGLRTWMVPVSSPPVGPGWGWAKEKASPSPAVPASSLPLQMPGGERVLALTVVCARGGEGVLTPVPHTRRRPRGPGVAREPTWTLALAVASASLANSCLWGKSTLRSTSPEVESLSFELKRQMLCLLSGV